MGYMVLLREAFVHDVEGDFIKKIKEEHISNTTMWEGWFKTRSLPKRNQSITIYYWVSILLMINDDS